MENTKKITEIDLGKIPLSVDNKIVEETILEQIYLSHRTNDFPIRIITNNKWDNIRICRKLNKKLRIVGFWRNDKKNNPSDFYVWSLRFGVQRKYRYLWGNTIV